MELVEMTAPDSIELFDEEITLNIAILNSLRDTGNESTSSTHAALETSVGQARATLPKYEQLNLEAGVFTTVSWHICHSLCHLRSINLPWQQLS